MTADPTVSVIVPLHRMTAAAQRCLREVLAIPGDDHELIVVSDHELDDIPAGARLLLTGAGQDTSPAEKRDHALPYARGRILAFLDDDAYPAPRWLEHAVERFDSDPSIAALGGPGITPPGSSLAERLGGAFYESRLGSGGLRYRFIPAGRLRDVDDYPAYNFFVRSDVLKAIGGWASRFYGGEDTKVCLSLVENGHRIVYDPRVVVNHFRRPMFRAHMRQVANVGRHRGYFVRVLPQTSARPVYFGPALLVVAAPLILLSALRSRRSAARLGAATAIGWGMVSATAAGEGFETDTAVLHPLGLVAGHGAYGIGFIRGLFTRDIDSM